MKTKSYAIAAGEKMKSAILYPYGPLTGTGCCRMVHAKHLAVTSAIYTLRSFIINWTNFTGKNYSPIIFDSNYVFHTHDSIPVISLYIIVNETIKDLTIRNTFKISSLVPIPSWMNDYSVDICKAYYIPPMSNVGTIFWSRMLRFGNLPKGCPIRPNISILIVLIYTWRISVNVRRSGELEDVYYGVQIAYFAIIGTQMSMIFLSVMLMFGIYKENPGLIVPWIIGFITFMALEAVAMVYSNVLRDHVNKQFDTMCKAEVTFFIARAFINVLAMWGVMRFYNLVRAGITWKGPEAKTTTSLATGCFLFDIDEDDDIYGTDADDDDDDDNDDDDTGAADDHEDDYYDDDDDSDSNILDHNTTDEAIAKRRRQRQRCRRQRPNVNHNNNIRTLFIKRHKYKITHQETRLEVIDELEKSAGSGSEENDSLLVAYDSNSMASV